MKRIHKASLVAFAAGVFFSYYLENIFHNKGQELGWLTVAQYTVLFCIMLVVWWTAPSARRLRDTQLILLTALVVRLVLIPVDPYTSNDVSRYLFDGKIALSGLDPYQVNHNLPELKDLKEVWNPPEEHASYPTLYPPLSLAVFSLAASAGVEFSQIVWKLVVTIAGILTVWVMALALKRLDRLRHVPLVALSPLLILETGVGMHVDAIATLAVSLFLYSWLCGKKLIAGICIGLGALTKILPIMLLLPLFCGQKRLKSAMVYAVGALGSVVCGYALILALGFIPIGSIGTLFEKWRFGAPVFGLLELVFEDRTIAILVMVSLVSGVLFLGYRSWKSAHFPSLTGPCVSTMPISPTSPLLFWSMSLVLLLSPVVFPWYLMVLVPFVAITPRPFGLAWLCTLPFTYEVLGGFVAKGVWDQAVWPIAFLSGGLLAALIYELCFRSSYQEQGSSKMPASNVEGD